MELNNLAAIIGIKIDDGGTYDISPTMANNIFVASDFKTLSKLRVPLGGITTPSGTGTTGEFIYVSNMGDFTTKPVLEVITSRNKRSFYGIGEDVSSDIVAIQWGETVLFYYPSNGTQYIYYMRFQSPDEMAALPQNPSFKSVIATDHIETPQVDIANWLLMYTKVAGRNPGIRLAQNFLATVGATATKGLNRDSCYIEIGGAEYAKDSFRLIGMGYQKLQNDLQPLMFGFQETDQSGNTKGDFVIYLREDTTNKTPVEKFRVTSDGKLILPFTYHGTEANHVAAISDVDSRVTNTINALGLQAPIFELPAVATVQSQTVDVNTTIMLNSAYKLTLAEYAPDNTSRGTTTRYEFIVNAFAPPAGQDWLAEIICPDVVLQTPYGHFKSIKIKKPSQIRLLYGINGWVTVINELPDASIIDGTA